ncbi:ABC-type Fe3+/spermidine/putrescine transport system ATPase subunit [Flavobacteriaceae bacterium MAR_2010_72]|nr:ABC-type Fe3+/spermidine/putrescine transport system ATPase subunit [Flavobacteriaceae bacterium MAR_2010_72]
MLDVKQLNFSYDKTPILKEINFSVNAGEHLAIIGESGSGKSTLLKLLYGEYDLTEGEIYWNSAKILGPKFNLVVGYEFIKYVAQEFDLMPFISVEENVGKYLSNFFPKEKKERTHELLEVVELSSFAKTKVKTLSGGQKQRVALARALAKQPELLLLDEPFSHIDNFKKQSLRRRLFRYLKDQNIACVVATHDSEDVLGYADQMIVLHQSKIIAKNSPEHLYSNPKTPLIASFFGEFNVINEEIIYACQLKVVAKSKLNVAVKQAFFKGSFYLIEADFKGNTLFFEHPIKLDVGKSICLEITK